MQNAYPKANHSTNSHNFEANFYNSKASSPKKDTYNQPKYIRVFGSSAGIVLNQAMYWTKTKTAGEREGWFYKSVRQWCEETGLTTSQVRSGIARLKAFGIVETWVGGFDNVTWYKVDLATVEAALKGDLPQKNLGYQSQSGLLPIAKRFATNRKPLYNELQKITSKTTTNKQTVNGDVLAVENVVVFDLKEEKKACRDEASSSPNQEENRYQTDTKPIPIFSGSNTSKIEDQKRRKTPKNDEKHPKTTNPTLSRLQRFGIAFSLSLVILQNYDEERVNEVLSVASAKNYGAGWIIKALREKWVLSGQQAAGTGSGRLLSYAEMLDYCNKNGLIGTGKQTKITDYFEAVRVSGQEKPLWRIKNGASSTMNSTPNPMKSNFSHHTGATLNENIKSGDLAYSKKGGVEGKYEA